MIVMGAMVADAAVGGDWTRIDMARLLAWTHAHAADLAAAVATIEPTDEVTAGKRVREWERAVRERRKKDETKQEATGQTSLPIDAGGEG